MTTSLDVAFIANLDSHDLLIASSPDGTDQWSNNTHVGVANGSPEFSGSPPCLAVFQAQFRLAFTSNNATSELLVCSSADGSSWTQSRPVGQSSKAAPAMAQFGGKLWLAFVANSDSNELLVTYSADGTSWNASNFDVHQSTKAAPALASFRGELWLAFTADNLAGDILVTHTADPSNWPGSSTPVGQPTKQSPALAVFNGRLWLAYIANVDSNDIMVCSSADGLTWTNGAKLSIPQSSKGAPTLTVLNGELWLGFVANNVAGDLLVCHSSDGAAWSDNVPIGQTSMLAPSIVGRELTSGTVRPLYEILTVTYAPPGTSGGKSSSKVDYYTGSTTGTISSTSNSFKSGIDVTATVGTTMGAPVNISGSGEFTASTTQTDSSSLEIRKSTGLDMQVIGPGADGINHDEDLIWLWLNPLINLTIDGLGNITWSLTTDGEEMQITYAPVAALKDPATAANAEQLKDLTALGFTAEDFANILAVDPFAMGNTVIDPNRFQQCVLQVPYKPPPGPTDGAITLTPTLTNVVTSTSTYTVQVQYGVKVTVSAGIKVPFTESVKVADTLEWTDTSSSGQLKIATQSASATMGQPAYGYDGPVSIIIYWDTIYSSFMFAFPATGPDASGSVVDAGGVPVASQALTLTVGSQTVNSFTDEQGGYALYLAQQGQPDVVSVGGREPIVLHEKAVTGTISIAGQEFTVNVGANEPAATLRLAEPIRVGTTHLPVAGPVGVTTRPAPIYVPPVTSEVPARTVSPSGETNTVEIAPPPGD